MKTLRTAALAALALGLVAPGALTAPRPEAKPTRLVTRRFTLKNCDPDDARQVFDAVADMAGPVAVVAPEGATPAGRMGGGPFGGAGAGRGGATWVAPDGTVVRVRRGSAAFPTDRPGPATPPAPRPTLSVVVDGRARALFVKGTEKDLELAADLVAVLDSPEDKAPPGVKHVRAFRTKRDAAEVYQILRGLDREPRYKAAAVGRLKVIIAAGPEEALKDLADTLREIDVPVPAR